MIRDQGVRIVAIREAGNAACDPITDRGNAAAGRHREHNRRESVAPEFPGHNSKMGPLGHRNAACSRRKERLRQVLILRTDVGPSAGGRAWREHGLGQIGDENDLLKPDVTRVIVCNPRKNSLLNAGSKSDRVDARKLSELLHAGMLTPVYHGENGARTLRELGRSYITVTKDLTRVMNRVKALYGSWAIPCAGEKVCSPRRRHAWLEKLSGPAVLSSSINNWMP